MFTIETCDRTFAASLPQAFQVGLFFLELCTTLLDGLTHQGLYQTTLSVLFAHHMYMRVQPAPPSCTDLVSPSQARACHLNAGHFPGIAVHTLKGLRMVVLQGSQGVLALTTCGFHGSLDLRVVTAFRFFHSRCDCRFGVGVELPQQALESLLTLSNGCLYSLHARPLRLPQRGGKTPTASQ